MTVLPTVQSAVYPRYVELLEMEPGLTITQAAQRLEINRGTLEKAIARAEAAIIPTRVDDMYELMCRAGEMFQEQGHPDMARKCYQRAAEIKEATP